MDYLFGVDGGNTKTDYFLFSAEGKLIDKFRSGTCSHEQFSEGFVKTKEIMSRDIKVILDRNNLKASDISASCFGLAGCDLKSQKEKLENIAREIGFKKFVVVNDSFLGIKAGTSKGYGVSSVNGTGTCCGGYDRQGRDLQIGGLGYITGDKAGGRQISRDVMSKVFDEFYRMGKKTSLSPITFEVLGITKPEELQEAVASIFPHIDYNKLTLACFEEASKGDEVAIDILKEMAMNLAKPVSSAILQLDLGEEPEVAMIGSVYVKPTCKVLNEEFKKQVLNFTGKNVKFNLVQVPPATGAIIWAKELHDGVFPTLEIRQNIIKELSE